MVRSQKYPLGVKVRKYFEGYDTPFLGSVVNFFANVGLYEIKYDDGDGEQMTEELVDRFVLPTSIPAEAAKIIQQEEKKKRQEEEARRIEQEANIVPEDPEKFIGTTVSKRHKTYDGQETEIGGSVAAYFSDKKRFRVKYSNGLYEDLTYHELQKCIEASDALRMQKSTEQFSSLASPSSRKRSREFSSDDEEQEEIKNNEPPAKQPMHSINSTSMNSMSQQNDSSQIRKTINESKLPTKETAYLALRHTLLLILQQNAVKTFHTPKQLTILKNEDLKSKKALMLFVEANGLKCLQKVIVYWFKSTGTHQGVQIVLRILAALPNVTPDHVLESGIGKTLRGIQMKCQNMDHLDQSLGDLATWVISSWKKKTAYRRHISLITPMRNYSVSINEKDPSQFVSNPNRSKREEERLKITKHLEQVLKGQVVQPLKKTSELPPVGTKSRKNSLGSQDAKKKEERRVIVIDTCTANVPKNITDWSKDSFGLSEKDFLYDKETVPMGRIKFGRPQIVRFETELEPFRLLETTRSKIMEAKLKAQQEQEIPAFANDQNSSMNSKEGLIPIAFRKNAKPIKSILRGVNEPKLL